MPKQPLVDARRMRALNDRPVMAGPVVYWMDRERRAADNWALWYAEAEALEQDVPLVVLYVLPKAFLDATWRSYVFLLAGLKETKIELAKRNILFCVRVGDPEEVISAFVTEVAAGLVVTDFSPLRVPRRWRERLAKRLSCSLVEVDARNIVPCWIASHKKEFAARTMRPKIHRLLPEFLTPFPARHMSHVAWKKAPHSDAWTTVEKAVEVDRSVSPVADLLPGERAARMCLKGFMEERLVGYASKRNDPTLPGQSGLSPYLHYGHISAQRVALAVRAATAPSEDKDAFLEELIVRRELSDNFCFYEPEYDAFDGFPDWAQTTLNAHRKDKRDYIYSMQDFERANTHDPLWNAAQREMMQTGKMHGYLRMYWAKKILEWTATPEDAIQIAIRLNDRYELDGRDANGYVGIAWSVGGVHDRPWFNRPIFGTVRYMSANGLKGKFDTSAYLARWSA